MLQIFDPKKMRENSNIQPPLTMLLGIEQSVEESIAYLEKEQKTDPEVYIKVVKEVKDA